MADGITSAKRQEAFVNEVAGLADELTRQLSEWAKSKPRMLLDMEQATLQVFHELGDGLLAGLRQLAASLSRSPGALLLWSDVDL